MSSIFLRIRKQKRERNDVRPPMVDEKSPADQVPVILDETQPADQVVKVEVQESVMEEISS